MKTMPILKPSRCLALPVIVGFSNIIIRHYDHLQSAITQLIYPLNNAVVITISQLVE